jgi:hypothetical protein
MNKVIVTGTRKVGTKLRDSAAPISVVSATDLQETGAMRKAWRTLSIQKQFLLKNLMRANHHRIISTIMSLLMLLMATSSSPAFAGTASVDIRAKIDAKLTPFVPNVTESKTAGVRSGKMPS